ncbi:caspase family protein [Streptomyces violens]|uniref:caspase family protein n=1 Tax=Streptomyces violens TaxID=66377 RepID=UPI00068ACF84|nr:caspase family protein [Streptomyces violens]
MTGIWFPGSAASRAVCIGVDSFQDEGLPPLRAVRNNLSDLRNALTHTGHGLFTPQDAEAEHCKVLGLDEPPVDQAAVGRALSRAAEEATDLLLVYYSGHGVLDDDGLLHLALPHTDRANLKYTALPLTHVKRDLAEARARARVLVLDCCFSGRAIEAMAAPEDLVVGQLPVSGTYTLTSTNATSPSYAPLGSQNSAFTSALLTALAAPRPLTLDEIFRHIRGRLRDSGLPGPQCRATGDAPRLALARGPVPPPPKSEVVVPLQEDAGRGGRRWLPRPGTRGRWAVAVAFALVVAVVVTALVIGAIRSNAGDGAGGGDGSGGSPGGDSPGRSAHVLRTVVTQWTHFTPDADEASHAGSLNAGRNYFYCKKEGEPYQNNGHSTSLWLRTDDDTGNRNVYVSAVSLDAHSYATFQDELPYCE